MFRALAVAVLVAAPCAAVETVSHPAGTGTASTVVGPEGGAARVGDPADAAHARDTFATPRAGIRLPKGDTPAAAGTAARGWVPWALGALGAVLVLALMLRRRA